MQILLFMPCAPHTSPQSSCVPFKLNSQLLVQGWQPIPHCQLTRDSICFDCASARSSTAAEASAVMLRDTEPVEQALS